MEGLLSLSPDQRAAVSKIFEDSKVKKRFDCVLLRPKVAQGLLSYLAEAYKGVGTRIAKDTLTRKVKTILFDNLIVFDKGQLNKAMNQLGSVVFKAIIKKVGIKEGGYFLLRKPEQADCYLPLKVKSENASAHSTLP